MANQQELLTQTGFAPSRPSTVRMSVRSFTSALFELNDFMKPSMQFHPLESEVSLELEEAVSIPHGPDLEGQRNFTLPPPQGSDIYRRIRWRLFSTYRRLFSVVVFGNLVALIIVISESSSPTMKQMSCRLVSAAAINLLLAILCRNEHIVNLLFFLSTAVPASAPLWLRKNVAKIYTYGGVHSGCATAAIAWYVAFVGIETRVLAMSAFGGGLQVAIVVVIYTILGIFLLILALAHPTMRSKYHDSFELSHRFAGWTAVTLFWSLVILNAVKESRLDPHSSLGGLLIMAPAFWCLIVITTCLVYPWLRLRSRKVYPEVLSAHAIRLHFDYGNMDYCKGIRLTDSPLLETHSFATLPEPVETCNDCGEVTHRPKGFSVLVSNAGDWTSRLIREAPSRIYTKGAPTSGVLRVAVLFSPVLVIATGSGIGPCLSLFQGRPQTDVRIFWATPSPSITFGDRVVGAVLRADPNALIWDTKSKGRPNVLLVAWEIIQREKCEAAVVISNPKVTQLIVHGLESRGVPAYGPVFDS